MFPPNTTPKAPYLSPDGTTVCRHKSKVRMKTKRFWVMLPLMALITACDDFGVAPGRGELRWTLGTAFLTKAGEQLPDTSDFILSIKDADGKVLYDGAYGDSPDRLEVPAGSYTFHVISDTFTGPAFDRPQYGDEQVVVVRSGESVTVRLECTLQNAGVRLRTESDFLTSYPDGTLYVNQGKTKLLYKYRETRIAYLFPGSFSLLLNNQGETQTLFTRDIAPREILTLKISAPAPQQGSRSSIEVVVDTSKVWTSDSFVIGGAGSGDSASGNTGQEPQDAVSVGEASAKAGKKDVWVLGYIVGGDLSTAGKTVKTSGISKKTHIALAERSSVTEKASCLAVELPHGSVRDALNLVDHPDLIGTRVYVKGNVVESYFATTGLKGTSDFVIK